MKLLRLLVIEMLLAVNKITKSSMNNAEINEEDNSMLRC